MHGGTYDTKKNYKKKINLLIFFLYTIRLSFILLIYHFDVSSAYSIELPFQLNIIFIIVPNIIFKSLII